MSARELRTNPDIYVLQAQYAVNNFQGNSRWTIVEPVSKALHGAIGKDQMPPVFSVLKDYSGKNDKQHNGSLDALVRSRLLVSEENPGIKPEDSTFLPRYHEFVKDYPFNDYASASRWGKDRELMFEYGKVAKPPPVYTDWNEHHGDRFQLPPPFFRDLFTNELTVEPVRALATALSAAFQATGSIDGGDFGPWLRKTSPSGGARHPTEAVVTIHGVHTIADGVYSYDPQTHQLVKLEIPSRKNVVTNKQPEINVILVARVERPMWRYRETRSFRAVLIDAGHVVTMLCDLFNLLGYSLEADRLPSSLGSAINFNAPVLATFRLTGHGLNHQQRVAPVATHADLPDVLKIDEYSKVNINPFLWLSFRDGTLIANASTPHAVSLPIDEVQFLVLNHCVVSKRGDRPSRSIDLIERFGISRASLGRLLNEGLLLLATEVTSLRTEIDLWCRRGWYQSLLAYVDMWSALREANPQTVIKNSVAASTAVSGVSASLGSHWEMLRTRRATTRTFTGEALPANVTDTILECARHELLSENSHFNAHYINFGSHVQDAASIRCFDRDRQAFVDLDRSINRSAVYSNTIGQFPLQKASLVFWLEVTTSTNASNYLHGLIRLGGIAQKLCVLAAERNVGVFMTPAVRDADTMRMLEIESDTDPMFYLLAFGDPVKKSVRLRTSSNGQEFRVSERLSEYEKLLTDGNTLLFDVDGKEALLCDSDGVLSAQSGSREDNSMKCHRC